MALNKKTLATLAATAGIVASGAVVAAPAHADSIPGGSQGFCGRQICLYYNSNEGGAMWASDASQWNDLAGQTFYLSGPINNNGMGQAVKNNAASVANGGYQTVYVYVNSSTYGWGPYDSVGAGGYGNLVTTYNNEASYSTTQY